MKKREMIIANSILAVLILCFGYLAFRLSVNLNSAPESKITFAQEEQETMQPCSDKKPLDIGETSELHLKKLSDYQDICGSFVTDKLMVFTGFSQDAETAKTDAATMADRLKQFYTVGVTPVIIAEPYIQDQAMSYKEYLAGKYDAGMDAYFKALKEAGITDGMMGTWVPFPESNTPSWNNKDTEPKDFALCVNKYLGKLKQYFPAAKGSILLNATTYEPDDANWENGDYIGFSEYIGLINRDLVDSFGIQGFPWVSNAQQVKRTIFNAFEFLQPDLAIGAAQSLRTRDIWINTGTFASKYIQDPAKVVHLSINERKALLNNILDVAKYIRDYQENEYRVTINLFSEDKSDATEQTDWSYVQDEDSSKVLKEFLQSANRYNIPLSLFDRAKWELH